MADRALTEEAVLAGLQDIRLPTDAPGGLFAELLAVIGMALLLALFLGLIARTLSRPRLKKTRQIPVHDQLAQLKKLPDSERKLALLHLLKDTRPEVFKPLAVGLYRPDGLPDADTLEKALMQNG
ncbi:hypothetical protein [uncultured Roseovarius sp.]|uniref:hypothetical protein n=1 Tax=uncultured Roseovarius sp. TaxID=293344 RepID=UPI002619DBFE|nr:hypothetical protein [uncultured Roseovarius sp.]